MWDRIVLVPPCGDSGAGIDREPDPTMVLMLHLDHHRHSERRQSPRDLVRSPGWTNENTPVSWATIGFEEFPSRVLSTDAQPRTAFFRNERAFLLASTVILWLDVMRV